MPVDRPSTPRLADIKASDAAQEVYDVLTMQFRELAELLGAPVAVKKDGIDARVRAIVAWAQQGRLEQVDDGEQALRTLERVLYVCPMDRASEEAGSYRRHANSGGPPSLITVVMAAARARLAIHRGDRVNAADLAALASVNPSRIRQLVLQGQLERYADGMITADSAHTWLSDKLPGFESPTLVRKETTRRRNRPKAG